MFHAYAALQIAAGGELHIYFFGSIRQGAIHFFLIILYMWSGANVYFSHHRSGFTCLAITGAVGVADNIKVFTDPFNQLLVALVFPAHAGGNVNDLYSGLFHLLQLVIQVATAMKEPSEFDIAILISLKALTFIKKAL